MELEASTTEVVREPSSDVADKTDSEDEYVEVTYCPSGTSGDAQSSAEEETEPETEVEAEAEAEAEDTEPQQAPPVPALRRSHRPRKKPNWHSV